MIDALQSGQGADLALVSLVQTAQFPNRLLVMLRIANEGLIGLARKLGVHGV